ncbi:MAG: glycosyltransferase family 2 protein [Sphingobium sp.]
MTGYSLVIPCYNEALSLPALIARCRELVEKVPGCEVVLVDNGSSDDSPAVFARELRAGEAVRSVRVEVNQGYGFGITEGLRACRGEVIGWTHADLQTDPMDAVAGFSLFASAADPAGLFVKGRRYGRPPADVLFTYGMSVFETILMRLPLRDINAQPTLFHRSLFESWADPPKDFSLDLFAYVTAKRAGCAVRRFPVLFAPRVHGQSHWNVDWKAKLKFIRRTLDYSLALRRRMSQGGRP